MAYFRVFAALSTLIAGVSPAVAAPPRPKLIVAISVDQFASELYRRYQPGYVGGLKTLSGGIAFPVGYQSHAATETCPGHSTILTGSHPSRTGIVANTWFDVKTGSSVYCVQAPGSSDPNARGPQNMRVETLGDRIKKAVPGSRSFALSGKDRAAITMAGKHADGVWWWVDGQGFMTSSFAGPATPAVTGPAKLFNQALFAKWKASPPQLWAAPSPSCAPLQQPHHFGKIDLSGHVPPDLAAHVVDNPEFLKTTDFQDNLRASPLFDATVAAFAEKLITQHKLGRGSGIDVLAVSLSANDYIGHRYGNGGAEMCVQQAALDASLDRFVKALEALHVPMVVVLTADHGATDAAEREQEHDPKAARLDSVAFVTKLNKAVSGKLDLAYDPIVGDDPQQLVINVGPDESLRARVSDAAVAWLKEQPEVREVFTRAEIEATPDPSGTSPDTLSFIQRFRESYDRDRSGDIAVAYAERTTFGVPRGPGDTVAGHGSPWNHDRQVPILFWWPGVTGETRDTPIETVDIMPTLAALASVPVDPKSIDGKCVNLANGDTDSCAGK